MKRELLKEKQPFGRVMDETPMGGEGRPEEYLNRPLGGMTMRPNNGVDHGPSFSDKSPRANAEACAHSDNPFFWTGHPKGGM